MKPLFLLPLVVLTALSCAEEDGSSIRLLGARPLGAECTIEGEIDQLAGSLDLAPLAAKAYLIGFNIQSTLEDPEDNVVGGNDVSGQGNNDFFLQEIRLSYASTPELNLPAQNMPLYGVFPAGSSEESFITTNLLPPAVYAALTAAPLPAANVTILVTVQLAGELGSGRDIESNEVKFPITVFNSGTATCSTGVSTAGPCGGPGGQDGTPICVPVDTTP